MRQRRTEYKVSLDGKSGSTPTYPRYQYGKMLVDLTRKCPQGLFEYARAARILWIGNGAIAAEANGARQCWTYFNKAYIAIIMAALMEQTRLLDPSKNLGTSSRCFGDYLVSNADTADAQKAADLMQTSGSLPILRSKPGYSVKSDSHRW